MEYYITSFFYFVRKSAESGERERETHTAQQSKFQVCNSHSANHRLSPRLFAELHKLQLLEMKRENISHSLCIVFLIYYSNKTVTVSASNFR